MNESENQTTLEHSIYWLQALVYQGKRVYQTRNIKTGSKYPYLNTKMMEEQFFLIACMKARRWLKKLKEIVKNKQPIEDFLEATEVSTIIRNKREHDDEYFGSGKKYEEEPGHDVEDSNGIQMNVGTSCTAEINGQLLLGGIFDVGEAISLSNSLQNTLRELQHAYWDKKGFGPLDHFKMQEKLSDC